MVSQTLVAIALQARGAARSLELGDPEATGRALAALADMTHLSHSALAQMGALRAELGPDGVAEHGLVGALTRHAAALAARENAVIEVAGPDRRLPLDAAGQEQLYRTGQEAIGSVLERTSPPAAWVVIAECDGLVVMEVGGDGVQPLTVAVPAHSAGA